MPSVRILRNQVLTVVLGVTAVPALADAEVAQVSGASASVGFQIVIPQAIEFRFSADVRPHHFVSNVASAGITVNGDMADAAGYGKGSYATLAAP